jgi:alpha-amylase
MHNICAGEPNYYVHSGNVAAQVRKSGAIIVLGGGSNQDVNVANGAANGQWLAPGTYTDKVGGATFTVTASTISGRVGSTGIAVIYNGTTTGGGSTGGNTGSNTGETTTNTFVYYNNPGHWGKVYCYLYNSETENNGAWPGTAMTFDATLSHDGITGWWKVEVPAAFANAQLIVNDGGSNQYPAAMQPGLQLSGKSAWLNGTTLTNDSGTESNTGSSTTYTPA